jgi:GR25 family glycosyltransferase involved in LPS biosynthesis
MKCYLINLKKRPDRLDFFNTNVKKFLPDIDIELVEAVDGNTLNLNDENLKKNVNPWNYKNLQEKTLRGVIGCCQSHLNCYEKIINDDRDYAVIFEDDCCFIKNKELGSNEFLKNLPIPEKFGIIWLNDWRNSIDKKFIDRNYYLVSSGAKTTEAYIVSKEFAKILYDENINNIGAIDAHIGQVYSRHPEYTCFNIKSNLFTQRDRKDSDIR